MTKMMPYLKPVVLVATVAIIIGMACILTLPARWASRAPATLNAAFGSYLKVENASFTHSPPTLTLTGVHLLNPAEIAPGSAVNIGRIDIVFKNYRRNPLQIETITVDNVHGRYIASDKGDNLNFLNNAFALRGQTAPDGELARLATVDVVNISHATIQNPDGSVVQELPDGQLVSADKPPASLQQVVIDVAGAVLRHQQTGVASLKVESFTEKATETIKSLGGALKKYLTTPGPPPMPF